METFYSVLARYWRVKSKELPASLSEPIEIADDDDDEDKEVDLSGVFELVKEEVDDQKTDPIELDDEVLNDPYMMDTEVGEPVTPVTIPVDGPPAPPVAEAASEAKHLEPAKMAMPTSMHLSDDALTHRIDMLK